MSELAQAIEEMRNMRESYDQLAAAAEAYNEGKPALAEAITAKGVEAAATDSLATMAEKVMIISQDTYEIDGGEMYAKQLFGVANNDIVPGYWNLYDILAQLLSDGRLVNYGGILLAEYYKGYDSLELAGAGAGGAYVVSDKDGDGNFIMYTEDTTHTWATEDDGRGNRWVAYCFAEEYHSFQISNTNTCPRSIFIGRKVGSITSMVNGRVSQIVVPDGNSLQKFATGSYTQNWSPRIVVKNLVAQNGAVVYGDFANIESAYIQAETISDAVLSSSGGMTCTAVLEADTISSYVLSIGNQYKSFSGCLFVRAESITASCIMHGYNANLGGANYYCSIQSPYIRSAVVADSGTTAIKYKDVYIKTEDCVLSCGGQAGNVEHISLMYYTNDKTKSVKLVFGNCANLTNVELENSWNKDVNLSSCSALTEANIYAHILQRLKQDEPDCGDGVTITLGTTNLAKLTSAESVQLLDDLTNIYGYTFA